MTNDAIEQATIQFPKDEEELIAATKGMVTLLYAYPINITASVLNGDLQYLDTSGFKHTFPAYERLKFKDCLSFVSLAFEQKNFLLASEILKQVFQMEKFIPSKSLLKSFKQFRANVVKMSNGYLMKTEKFVGKNNCLLYIIILFLFFYFFFYFSFDFISFLNLFHFLAYLIFFLFFQIRKKPRGKFCYSRRQIESQKEATGFCNQWKIV